MKTATSRTGLGGGMTNAAHWLTPPVDAPWRWDADGGAVLWDDGTTLVMAEELAVLCERFGPRCPPPASACFATLALLKGRPGNGYYGSPPASSDMPTWLGVHIRRPEEKQLLLEMLLSELEETLPAPGTAIASLIRMNWRPALEDQLQRRPHPGPPVTRIRDLLAQLQQDAFQMRLKTGLEGLVKAGPDLVLTLSAASSADSLLDHLELDPETAGLVRLTRDVMAALTLPQLATFQRDRAMGGVADLGNRGPLHRLLLSELAHDDEMLAARLALGEALYLQPEPPAQRPPASRVLLLDAGLRLWGAARVFSVAAALALRVKARSGTEVAAWTACGRQWTEADLSTADGVKDQLQILETTYDLREALPALPGLLGQSPGTVEPVLFIHQATVASPEFRQALVQHLEAWCPLHLVSVDAEGLLSLHQLSHQGLKTLHQARLSLEKLITRPSPAGRHGERLLTPRPLPAALHLPQLPFLTAPVSSVVASLQVRQGRRQITYGLTQSREVWYLFQQQPGGRALPAPPLKGKVLEFRTLAETPTTLVAAAWEQKLAQAQVLVVPMPDEGEPPHPQIWVMTGMEQQPSGCWVDGDCLVILCSHHIRALRLTSGEELPSLELPPGLRHLGERHFCPAEEGPAPVLHCLVQGNTITLPPFGATTHTRPLLAFHRHGQLGMWTVGANGAILSPSGSHHMEGLSFPHRLAAAKASPGGQNVWMKTHQGVCFIRDLDTGQLTPQAPDQGQWPFYIDHNHFARFSMRIRFQAVGLTPGGEIALRSVRGRTAVIRLSNTWFRLETCPNAVVRNWCMFGEPEGLASAGILRMAEWPDGSRAFLDERGLLHLQPANPALVEICIGLPANMMLPVWTSDGLLVGPAATMETGRPVTGHAPAIERHIRRFVTETLS